MTPIKSNQIINNNIRSIDFQGIEVFKKKENLLDSEIFGIPLKWVLIVAGLVYYFRGKR